MSNTKTLCKQHNWVNGMCINCEEICEHPEHRWEEYEPFPAYPEQQVHSYPVAVCNRCDEGLEIDPPSDEDNDPFDFVERE